MSDYDYEIIPTIMRRDGISRDEAQSQMDYAIELVLDGSDPDEVVRSEFGLEPDYVMNLLESLT